MSYQYSQEARDRISALGLTKITDFIDEVPVAFRKPFYDRQPSIPGFRRGTPHEFKKKQERLVSHLVHQQLGSKGDADWKLFANLWVAWATSRLDAAFPKNDAPAFQPDAGVAFLKHLADQFPDAPRETVERLICFSGFSNHTETPAALGYFHPASTIARDRMIDGLPGRLDKIEGYIEIAEPAAEEAAERIDQLESDLATLAKTIDDQVAANASHIDREVSQLQTALNQVSTIAERIDGAVHSLDVSEKQNSESISVLNSRVESLDRLLDALSAKAEQWAGFSSELGELREAIDQVRRHEPGWTDVALAVEVAVNRLDTLELNISKAGDSSSSKPQARIFETDLQGPFVEIISPETACETIAWNLQACGILKGNAATIARQIFAALTTGQMIQFTGSIADLVADSIANAVCGPIFHEWRVPVGLISDEIATDCLEMVGESSGCLILKGANRSAFEVYGTAIRDVVVRRQYGVPLHRRLVLIATWAQGPAAFSDGGTLAELGPVFDTDAFRMRGVGASLPTARFGHLVSGAWDQIQSIDHNPTPPLFMELKDALREAGFSPGNLWLRNAERALVHLAAMPGASAEENLHSMMTCWAQPWARATDGPADDIGRLAAKLLADIERDVAQLEGI